MDRSYRIDLGVRPPLRWERGGNHVDVTRRIGKVTRAIALVTRVVPTGFEPVSPP
jgi:hypothetical protein